MGQTLHADHWAPHLPILRAVLDRLQDGIQVWSLDGATIYENTVMERMLTASGGWCGSDLAVDPAEPLPAAVDRARRRVATHPNGTAEEDAGEYIVIAEAIDLHGDRDAGRVVLVRVCDSAAAVVTARSVGCHYGLTPRQSEVACLLARGYRNDAIARALGMSSSTARRHTESVLARLRLRTRAEVAALFAREAAFAQSRVSA